VSNNSQPANEPSILGKFASVVGLLGASLYFTGWIYRWAYYSFFQLEVTTLDLPVESFLLVPIQVLFGNIWAIGWTAIAVILIILFIYLTLWLLQNLGNLAAKLLNLWQQKIIAYYQRQRKKSWLAKMLKSLAEFSYLKISSIQFLRSLLDETVIVAWVLIALFFLAKQQGFTDARRDAINNTSTLPVVTLVASEGHLSVGRNPEDTGTTPSLQKYRFLGDLGLLESLQGQGYNDTLDPKNPRVWRLLMERGGWIYLFRTLSATAASDERPLVLAIKEGDSGVPLMLLSPEYTKPSSK
jgi:hypothetical protein